MGKEPLPEPAVCTAQPPPLLTLDSPAPVGPHSPSGQLPAESSLGSHQFLQKLKSMGCADEVTGVLDKEPKKWKEAV